MAPRKARNFNGYIPKFEVSSVELHATFVSPRPTYLLLAPRRWDPCWVAAVHRSGEIKLALLSWFAAYARQNSPSARKTPQFRRCCVSRANFVSHKARYASCWAKNVSPTGAVIRLAAHAATSTPTARLECAVKLVARGYCTTWGAIALLCC